MLYRHILLDLDGTLTDPFEGICRSIMYALEKAGFPVGKPEDYLKFVGPPLPESLEKYCGASPEDIPVLMEYYRERYSGPGLFENRLYPGIVDMLDALKKAGAELILATNKPEPYTLRILEHFGLLRYFDFVSGSTLDGQRGNKTEVIAWAVRQRQLAGCLQDCVMIGDRRHDMEGAIANHIPCIGVLYGYGSREELSGAGADRLIETVENLKLLLLS